VAVLPNDLFRIRLEDGSERTAHVGGELRRALPRLLPGDRVCIELSAIDPTKARISSREGQLAVRQRAPGTNDPDSNSESQS
jgi:translation initiation factor IF-1